MEGRKWTQNRIIFREENKTLENFVEETFR